MVSSLLSSTASKVKTGLAGIGFVSLVAATAEFRRLNPPQHVQDKSVLVVPFHDLQLVERTEGGNSNNKKRMQVQQLVDTIYRAAQDDRITALYGTIGHTTVAGWGHLEEVREALRAFRATKKPLYCYSTTLTSLEDPSHKDYYLASIFDTIHLQQQGELYLLGSFASAVFAREFLNDQGITAHVFKQGQYKNAPSVLTETKLSRAHKENMTSILTSIQMSVWQEMAMGRAGAGGVFGDWLFTAKAHQVRRFWNKMQRAGIFDATVARQMGLVDYTPRVDPLMALLAKTKPTDWDVTETNFDDFPAQHQISVHDYAKVTAQSQDASGRLQEWLTYARDIPYIGESLASTIAQYTQPQIALLYATGGLGDEAARRLIPDIRHIGQQPNVKAVVLRVDSPGGSIEACESIAQELQQLKIPMVVSMGNVAASGGYYISAPADKIFANDKTLTGSIGVFGVRLDLTKLAEKWGFRVQHVVPLSSSSNGLATMQSPWTPLTRPMQRALQQSMYRAYAQFQKVVAEGRTIPLRQVGRLAQGRVYTGKQAMEKGLVDSKGGLHEALEYAQTTYAKTDDCVVTTWPRRKSLFARIQEVAENQGDFALLARNKNNKMELIKSLPATSYTGVMMTMDEQSAIQCLVEDFPLGFWQ